MFSGQYFEDVEVGDKFVTASRTLVEEDVVAFVNLYNYFPQLAKCWTGEDAEEHNIFHGRLVPGMLCMVAASGLGIQSGFLIDNAMAQLGMSVHFFGPTFLNDTIHVEVEVTTKKTTSKPDRGVVTLLNTVFDQNGRQIMSFNVQRLVRRRPTG